MTRIFEEGIRSRSGVGLAQVSVLPVAYRLDLKYLVPVERLGVLVSGLDDSFGVLEVDGERLGRRHTVYFDTSALTSYHAHRQGRRRRYKIRTRHYGDPSFVMLEVKCKGGLGETAKFRQRHGAGAPDRLDAAAHGFVRATVRQHYGLEPDLALEPVLTTDFTRTALIDLGRGERLTIDRDVRITWDGRTVDLDRRWAIVESKSAGPHPAARHVLHLVGARPGPVSKYCLGVALFRPDLPSNRWRRALRRLAA